MREVIERLIAAGLDSIPGGGAEILDDEIRYQISPLKCSTDTWLDVMREAHGLGLRTTATMVFGFGEQPRHIVSHLERLRALQDETSGFTAFICWPFQAEGTRLKLRDDTTAMRYLRVFALSRLYLDNFPSLQVSWPTMGPEVGQVALRFGGNDFGSRDDRGERRVAGGRDLQALRRRHRALHPHRRLHAPPPQHALRAAGGVLTGDAVRVVSARWVVPIARPPIADGALALADDGAVLAVGSRAEVRAEFPDAHEERAEGVLLPGLVNAHCHLELSLHDCIPSGDGLFTWATALMRARAGDRPADVSAAATGAAVGARICGTAAIGDVGNSLVAVEGIRRAGLGGVAVSRAVGFARSGDG